MAFSIEGGGEDVLDRFVAGASNQRRELDDDDHVRITA